MQQVSDRQIRSFIKREGRLTKGQARALEIHWPTYGLTLDNPEVLRPILVLNKPIVLEIGFGMGSSLIEMANNQPNYEFIGIEVHTPGVGSCLMQIIEHQLHNLHIFKEDAVEVLKQVIPDNSLHKVQIFFPDPWHKKRHHKRRLIQTPFIELLLCKLQQGGQIHIATDWQPYAEHCCELLSAHPQLRNDANDSDYISRPQTRPLTKFEARGHRLGHQSWDLLFIKQ